MRHSVFSLRSVFRNGVAQGNIEPATLDFGHVEPDGIAFEVDAMTNKVQPFEVALDAQIADEIDCIGLELLECQLVDFHLITQEWQQLHLGNELFHIGYGVFLLGNRVVGLEHFQSVELQVEWKRQVDALQGYLHAVFRRQTTQLALLPSSERVGSKAATLVSETAEWVLTLWLPTILGLYSFVIAFVFAPSSNVIIAK